MAGRILIIDDEKDMLVLLQRIISEETDHKLDTATNPVKAVELFKKSPFDLLGQKSYFLIIAWIFLPFEISGWEKRIFS